jgi:Domain of unknown function (DUF4430)
VKRGLLALVCFVLLAGCGGAGEEDGTATLWITRDRGAEVLYEGSVPAGLTVLQALDREVDVETRYGGRFVQAIEGVEGSLSKGRDWFYFVNGVAADKGAAEYRLHPGEIVWWDFRRWQGEPETRIVVGAFPEPFLHGYDGKRRPAAVRYQLRSQEQAARAIAKLIGADTVSSVRTPVPEGANAFVLMTGPPRFTARLERTDGPYRFTFAGDALRLARNPKLVRFRYEGMP